MLSFVYETCLNLLYSTSNVLICCNNSCCLVLISLIISSLDILTLISLGRDCSCCLRCWMSLRIAVYFITANFSFKAGSENQFSFIIVSIIYIFFKRNNFIFIFIDCTNINTFLCWSF